MSIDLEWANLDSTLSSKLVELLNKHLLTINRPSFIGPVEVTSFEFGSAAPDVEVVDIRDIHRDFLEDNDDEDASVEPIKADEEVGDDDSYEWVSRKSAGRGLVQEGPAYHHLPPHLRYGRSASSDFIVTSPPPGLQSPRNFWDGGMSLPSLPPKEVPLAYSRRASSTMDFSINRDSTFPSSSVSPPLEIPVPRKQEKEKVDDMKKEVPTAPDPPNPPSNHPDLQLHLRILYDADIRITIATSLLINYPSPMFMSLPIKLSVVGLVFSGEVAAAYEGSRRRLHICILDDLDPYGLSAERRKRDSSSATPPEMEGVPSRIAKPLPIGQRLLPSIFIESEIGQTDKHVLKNVTRVERFIQDVIRKTLEEELVFPNFHTLILGDA